MTATELWQWVHSSYGDELGLTSDDDDYVAPSTEDDTKTNTSTVHSDRVCESSSLNTSLKLYSVDSLDVSTHAHYFFILYMINVSCGFFLWLYLLCSYTPENSVCVYLFLVKEFYFMCNLHSS